MHPLMAPQRNSTYPLQATIGNRSGETPTQSVAKTYFSRSLLAASAIPIALVNRIYSLALQIFNRFHKHVLSAQVISIKMMTVLLSPMRPLGLKIETIVAFLRLKLGGFTGYLIGPILSLTGACIVRLSLGKRVATLTPLYFSLFIATTVLITVWAVQFFKDPKVIRAVQNKGVTGAILDAIPTPKAKIVESMHSRNFLNWEGIEHLFVKPSAVKFSIPSELEVRKEWASLVQYCDWIQKTIKFKKPVTEKIQCVRALILMGLQNILRKMVLREDVNLLEELLIYITRGGFEDHILSVKERSDLLKQYGLRLALFIKKPHVQMLFPKDENTNVNQAIMDALLSQNFEKIVDYTNTSGVDANEIIHYGDEEDPVLSMLDFNSIHLNLVQASVLMGDIESLKRIVASSTTLVDWHQKDERGSSLLTLAALSGNASMTYYLMKECHLDCPAITSIEYLHLLYASIKGNNLAVFKDLYNPILDNVEKGIHRALSLDLYEKAIIYGAVDIQNFFCDQVDFNKSDNDALLRNRMIKAAVLGGNKSLFLNLFHKWKTGDYKNPSDINEFLRLALSGHNTDPEIVKGLMIEVTLVAKHLSLTCSQLATAIDVLTQESVLDIIERMSSEELLHHMTQRGRLFYRLIKAPVILEAILNKSIEMKLLLLACGIEAIGQGQASTLKMLCLRGLDCLQPLPDSNESLLSYSIVSFNPTLVGVILGTCPPLPENTISDLKTQLIQLQEYWENEVDFQEILRLLEAKSLKLGVLPTEDAQLKKAILIGTVIGFTKEKSAKPKEESVRGLLATGLGLFGFKQRASHA